MHNRLVANIQNAMIGDGFEVYLNSGETRTPVYNTFSPTESEFVKKCRRSLKAADSSRLPILSSLDDGVNPSEPKIFRLFLNVSTLLLLCSLKYMNIFSQKLSKRFDYDRVVIVSCVLRHCFRRQTRCASRS